MTVLAGTIRGSGTANAQWVATDRKPYYVYETVTGLPRAAAAPGFGDRRDYARRVGRKYGWVGFGPYGWRFNVPTTGGFVKLNDDSADT